MVRPELAVLLAYAKISLTGALVRSDLPDDPSFEPDLQEYFPRPIVERFGAGRFSAVGETLVFSATDNSDPRSNGRRYSVVRPTPIRRRVRLRERPPDSR